MKRLFAFFISLWLVFLSIQPMCAPCVSAVEATAQSFVLIDANTGYVLAEHNSNQKMKMASTTKIMTTLLALEYAESSDKTVTFTEDMQAEGSSMYLGVGDKVRLSDLCAGMMMASGNDAANAVALTLAESFADFATLMNNRADKIGMANTNFVTPSGLDDDSHYSTAFDMALLMSEALQNKAFASLTSCKSKKVDFISPEDKSLTYSNHNRLLSLYENCIGGKTGYTEAAGRCLVTAAEKNGVTLVAVTLNAPDDWNDHISLYEYGFSLYSEVSMDDRAQTFSVNLSGGEAESVTASADEVVVFSVPANKVADIQKKIYLPDFVFAPVKQGDVVGSITYSLDGVKLAEVYLVASASVSAVLPKRFFAGLFL